MSAVMERSKISTHLTTRCWPRANGKIRRLRKEVLWITTAILSKRKLPVIQCLHCFKRSRKLSIIQYPDHSVRGCKLGWEPMDVCTGFKPPFLSLAHRTVNIQSFGDVKRDEQEEIAQHSSTTWSFEADRKRISQNQCHLSCLRAKKHNVRTDVLPWKVSIGDYKMIRAHVQRKHSLQAKRQCPMRVKEAKSSLILVVEDLMYAELITVPSQTTELYAVNKRRCYASDTLNQTSVHYNTTLHWVDLILWIGKWKGTNELKNK